MTAKFKTRDPGPETSAAADWVVDMQRHFQANGYYRVNDLQRLLGDPRAHTEIKPVVDPVANFAQSKR